MTNNSNPLNGYRYDTREKGIETRGEQFAKLVNGSTASNQKADAKQDKEIKKVANDLATFKKNVYTKPQADGKFLTDKSLAPYAKKADVYTKAEVDAKIPPEQDLSSYAKIEYVDNQISSLIAGAPGELDTLKEAADAINANIDSINAISAGLDAKANAADVYNKTEVDSALAEKANATDLDAKANAVDVYTKTEVDGLIPDVSEKVDWVESEGGRKHIVLPNHNNLLGTDTEGGTYNLAMVSKWNVADFGTSQLHMNLNSVDGNVTINDDKQIATVDQIPDVSNFALASDVETALAGKANTTDLDAKANTADVYTKPEVDAKIEPLAVKTAVDELINQESSAREALATEVANKVDWVESTPGRKHVVLANHDSILGTDTTGGTYNVAMVSKWDVADFGSSKLHMNLNSLDGNVTINDDKTIATVDQIPEVDNFATKEELQNAIAGIAIPDMELYYKKAEVDALLREHQAQYMALMNIVGKLGGDVVYEYPNDYLTGASALNTLMTSYNGITKVVANSEFPNVAGGIASNNTMKLNMNGKTLTHTRSGFPAIMARATQNYTIYGSGTIEAGNDVCIQANGTGVTINLTGNTTNYHNNNSGAELIYCYQGLINICGGVFRNDGEDKSFMINCYDANYRNGTANIVIYSNSTSSGPKFYDFNPADCGTEGEHTNFVRSDCEVRTSTVTEGDVEHTVYMVVKSA